MKTYNAKEAAEYLKLKQSEEAPSYQKLVRWYNSEAPQGPRCTWASGKPSYSQADLDAWVADPKTASKPEPRPKAIEKHGGGRHASKGPAKAPGAAATLPGDLAAIRRLVEREEAMQSIVGDLSKLLKRIVDLYSVK